MQFYLDPSYCNLIKLQKLLGWNLQLSRNKLFWKIIVCTKNWEIVNSILILQASDIITTHTNKERLWSYWYIFHWIWHENDWNHQLFHLLSAFYLFSEHQRKAVILYPRSYNFSWIVYLIISKLLLNQKNKIVGFVGF